MSGPLVSCIVPVLDGERYLNDALASIRAQTHRQLEIIVVDDGSSDGTAKLLETLGAAIRVERHRHTRGPSAARNTGIARSTGAFLAFLDADDLWEPRKLEVQLRRFSERPDLDVCYCRMATFSDHDEVDELRVEDAGTFGPPAMLARRRAFDCVGGFDPDLRLGEDKDWLFRGREAGLVIEMVPETLVRVRRHRRSLTRTSPCDTVTLEMLKRSLDRRRDMS